MIEVGLVILNYGTPNETCDLLDKIVHFNGINKIVIVNNPSGDNSLEEIVKHVELINSNKIKVIESNENGGYARGNNIGLKYLVEHEKCDVCFISNPDVIFEEKDIDEIVRCFNVYNDYGVFTCRRKVNDNSKLRQYWKLPTYFDIISDKLFIFRYMRRKNEVFEINSDKDVIETPVAPGAFWAVRSCLLDEVNYLDENTFLFYEENCFARRIASSKYKIGLVIGAEYCVLAGRASTYEMKRTGKMMKYLLDSQRYYLQKYLHVGRAKMFIYDIFCKINAIELGMNSLIKRGKR